jgi:hypothetical protein
MDQLLHLPLAQMGLMFQLALHLILLVAVVEQQVLQHPQWQGATEDSMVLAVVAVVVVVGLHQAKAATDRKVLLLSQLIFNMTEKYAIINTEGGWLEFITDWDKDLYPLWEPLPGRYAVLASEINLSELPNIFDPVEIFVDIEVAGSY